MAQPLAPEPAAAGAQPEAPAAPAAPVVLVGAPRSYRELLSDEARSPNRNRLGSYLQRHRFEGGVGILPQPTVLCEQTVLFCDRQPMSFLALVAGPSGFPELSVLN